MPKVEKCVHCGSPIVFHWWQDNYGTFVHILEDTWEHGPMACPNNPDKKAEPVE